MLAPYPNRLRSSRSTPAQSDANSPSASTSPPPPPPSHAFPPSTSTSTAQHRLFSSRSSLPLTRMRTNSLSSSSLPQSDAPSISTGHAPPRPQRNPTRRPILPSRPSTSSGIPDKKQSQVPIVISSPFVGVAPVPPFADFMPSRRRSTKRPSSRKESVPPTHSKGSGFTSVDPAKNDPRFSTPDRAILEEIKLGAAARASQFKIIGNKKHHSYPVNEAPYPCNYERPVIDHDVWETGFIRQLCTSQTFHVFETPPTKVLDLGCGSGYWILECAKIWRNCEFVGLDLVHLHPDLSHLRSSDLGSRIKWVPANCLEGLPFPNEEFDFVHIKRIAHGIPEDKWDFLLEEISRVMKPGGAIEMIEEDLFFPGQSPDSPPLSRSPTPIPHLSTTSPTSSIPLPNGQHYSTNDQRSPSQFGSTATITAPTSDPRIYSPSLRGAIGTTSMLTFSTSIRNTDTIILPGSSDNLYFDNARPASSLTMNPRDHSLLEYIYTEMHAARFINLSPLSLLANSLPVYFNNVRSHAPIMFMFPPLDLAGVTEQLSRSPDDRGTSDRRPAQRYHEDSGKTSSVTSIGGRQILNHTQQYVVLDESAVAPGTITARQKASSNALHLPCAASNLGTPMQNNLAFPSAPVSPESLSTEVHSTSTVPVAHPQAAGDDKDPASRLNTLPNQRLRFDLQSLNMHLSTRVTEILACAEAMWEWVCKYQDAHRSHGGQPHVHKEHSQPRNVRPGERDDASKLSAELIGMSRAEFDVLLTRLELDMRDCVNIESRITSAFHAPAPSLELTNDRKAFDNACEKWEEYQIKQRERYRARSVGISPKEGADPSIAGSSEFDDGEAAGSARLRLSRTIRVFCAWKAS